LYEDIVATNRLDRQCPGFALAEPGVKWNENYLDPASDIVSIFSCTVNVPKPDFPLLNGTFTGQGVFSSRSSPESPRSSGIPHA